jgi:hypothetical protein
MNMMIKRILGTCAVTIVAVVSAAGVWLGGAAVAFLADSGTALAPEPARVREALGTTQGTTGAAYYVNTGTLTGVVSWPGSYSPSTSLAPGTPCSTAGLGAGQQTSQVIVANGNYRKCQ